MIKDLYAVFMFVSGAQEKLRDVGSKYKKVKDKKIPFVDLNLDL